MMLALAILLEAASIVPADAKELPLAQFKVDSEFIYMCTAPAGKYDGLYTIIMTPGTSGVTIEMSKVHNGGSADLVRKAAVVGVKTFGASGWIFHLQEAGADKADLRVDIGAEKIPMAFRSAKASLDDYTCTLAPPRLKVPSK